MTKFDKQQVDSAGQLVIMKLRGGSYGIDIHEVKELVDTPKFKSLPNSIKYVKGIGSIRGENVLIIDLFEKFGLKKDKKDVGNYPYLLVLKVGGGNIAILLSEVPVTVKFDMKDFDNSSEILKSMPIDREFVEGVVNIDSNISIILNTLKLAEIEPLKVALKKIKKIG